MEHNKNIKLLLEQLRQTVLRETTKSVNISLFTNIDFNKHEISKTLSINFINIHSASICFSDAELNLEKENIVVENYFYESFLNHLFTESKPNNKNKFYTVKQAIKIINKRYKIIK